MKVYFELEMDKVPRGDSCDEGGEKAGTELWWGVYEGTNIPSLPWTRASTQSPRYRQWAESTMCTYLRQ